MLISTYMGTITTNEILRSIIHVFLFCPVCRTMRQDKRNKRKAEGFTCHIYRASETSVTMECRECSLRFMVTWHSLKTMLKNRMEQHKDKNTRKYYQNLILTLDYFVDTAYSTRKSPGYQ